MEVYETLQAVRRNNYILIDNHIHQPKEFRVGVWKHSNGVDSPRKWEEFYVVALPQDGSKCCLNEVYVDDNGIPHLSTCSVGDNIWAGHPSEWHPEKNLAEGCDAYNWFYTGTEAAHGHPINRIGFPNEETGEMEYDAPFYNNRILLAEGRQFKWFWSEDQDHGRVIR